MNYFGVVYLCIYSSRFLTHNKFFFMFINQSFNQSFYRAMHFSAFAQSWDRMSSVCPSVCNVGDL